MWPFPQVIYGFGGRIVKDFPNDMHPVFDSPEVIKAAEYYAELLQKYGYKGTLSAHYKDVSAAMQQGKMAMLIDGHPGVGPYEDPSKSLVAGKLGFHFVPGLALKSSSDHITGSTSPLPQICRVVVAIC